MTDRFSLLHPKEPLVDGAGRIASKWYDFLQRLWVHVGAAGHTRPLYEDVIVGSLSMHLNGSNDPTIGTVQTGLLALEFDPNAMQEAFFCLQIPHAWSVGTAIKPFVQWAPSTNGAGGVVWRLDYSWSAIGDAFAATATIGVASDADGAKKLMLSSFADIGAGNRDVSSCLLARVWRDASDTDDTYADTAYLISAGVHIEASELGTFKVQP